MGSKIRSFVRTSEGIKEISFLSVGDKLISEDDYFKVREIDKVVLPGLIIELSDGTELEIPQSAKIDVWSSVVKAFGTQRALTLKQGNILVKDVSSDLSYSESILQNMYYAIGVFYAATSPKIKKSGAISAIRQALNYVEDIQFAFNPVRTLLWFQKIYHFYKHKMVFEDDITEELLSLSYRDQINFVRGYIDAKMPMGTPDKLVDKRVEILKFVKEVLQSLGVGCSLSGEKLFVEQTEEMRKNITNADKLYQYRVREIKGSVYFENNGVLAYERASRIPESVRTIEDNVIIGRLRMSRNLGVTSVSRVEKFLGDRNINNKEFRSYRRPVKVEKIQKQEKKEFIIPSVGGTILINSIQVEM